MDRLYNHLIKKHLKEDPQMVFIMGPRQVGKTTTSLSLRDGWSHVSYFNWDNQDQRELILKGPAAIAEEAGLMVARPHRVLIIFDEIHKYSEWKTFLKGFYDTYKSRALIVVTGSARLDVFNRGGDSLMGRYFPYRLHPLSVGEILHPMIRETEILPPKKIADELFEALWQFGGFPDPFLKRDIRFSNRWNSLRFTQLFQEDLRDLTRIQEVKNLEVLANLLKAQVGQLLTYESLAKKIRITGQTVRKWLEVLSSLYYCYEIRPWAKNITRTLIKEPKFYLWDWTLCEDGEGARAENFIASHLLKSVHYWTDCGFGHYNLYFLRDKDKREVDFLVTKNNKPWFLVEVKTSHHKAISSSLHYFQEQTKAPFAFQVALDLPYEEVDCFQLTKPSIVSARTFLSQLL